MSSKKRRITQRLTDSLFPTSNSLIPTSTKLGITCCYVCRVKFSTAEQVEQHILFHQTPEFYNIWLTLKKKLYPNEDRERDPFEIYEPSRFSKFKPTDENSVPMKDGIMDGDEFKSCFKGHFSILKTSYFGKDISLEKACENDKVVLEEEFSEHYLDFLTKKYLKKDKKLTLATNKQKKAKNSDYTTDSDDGNETPFISELLFQFICFSHE